MGHPLAHNVGSSQLTDSAIGRVVAGVIRGDTASRRELPPSLRRHPMRILTNSGRNFPDAAPLVPKSIAADVVAAEIDGDVRLARL